MKPFEQNEKIAKATYDCVSLASSLAKIKSVEIDSQNMLFDEIRKETYIWIQSIYENNFEKIEDPKMFLQDLSNCISAAKYAYKIVISTLGANGTQIWEEEEQKVNFFFYLSKNYQNFST